MPKVYFKFKLKCWYNFTNVPQMYFFCRNNVDLKYIFFCKSTSWSILEVYFKNTIELYFQYIWSILEVYFTLVQVGEIRTEYATVIIVKILVVN